MKLQPLVLCFIGFICCIDTMGQTKNFIDQPYIEVTGNADSLIIPNQIFLKFTITEKDSRDRTPLEEIETKMVDSLRSFGIDTDKKLSTNDIGSAFKYYFLRGNNVIKSKNYILELSDAVTATRVLMLLELLDISNASVHKLNHTNMAIIKQMVRINAIKNAKETAMNLAKAVDQNIGSAIFISETEPKVYNSDSQIQLSEVVVKGYQIRGQPSLDRLLPQIEFSKIQVNSTVSVKFILR